MRVLLPPERIKIQPIEITNEPDEESVEAKHEEAEELVRSHTAEPHAEPQPKHKGSVETEDLDEELVDLSTLPDRVKESNRNDVLFTKIREYLANPADHDQPTDVYLRGSRAVNSLLYKDNKL